MRLGRRPADDRVSRLGGQDSSELALQLLRADDDHSRELEPAQLPLQLCRDRLQVVLRELVDVALVPRLRPATLVVLARLLLREVGDLLELPGAQPVEEAQLAADVRNDRALAAADERDERREVEVAPDLDLVRHGLAERQRLPDVVEPGAEHRDAVGAVPVELLAEEVLDPLEVLAQPDPLLVGLVTAVGAVRLRALVDEGVDASLHRRPWASRSDGGRRRG